MDSYRFVLRSEISTAFDFRRWLQGNLLPHLSQFPVEHPLADYQQGAASLPRGLHKQWPSVEPQAIQKSPDRLQEFPLDHAVKPSFIRGGSLAAHQQLKWFIKTGLPLYGEERSHPDTDAASGLSPYLHFGHISPQQIFTAVMKTESWKTKHIQPEVTGSNEGWWGTSPTLESFLDELITWRELGYVFAFRRADYYRYSSLPDWARVTLEKHASDPREFIYTLDQFAASQTHDALWNAAQTQLREEGRMQNYLRMLWGKKILEWTDHPREALKIMLELNNRYAIDGRNPNSYSGIFWVLGRFDRPWAPERKIFGVIRYMSSDNTQKKLRLKKYLAKYGPNRVRSLNFEA